jgi:hypothetical protein
MLNNCFRRRRHRFEEHFFRLGTTCSYCQRKIWMQSGRRCDRCSLSVHKKCEMLLSVDHLCDIPSTKTSNSKRHRSKSNSRRPMSDEMDTFRWNKTLNQSPKSSSPTESTTSRRYSDISDRSESHRLSSIRSIVRLESSVNIPETELMDLLEVRALSDGFACSNLFVLSFRVVHRSRAMRDEVLTIL